MTDNVGYTPGVGASIAADDIDGVLYQRVKMSVGEDGEAVDVSEAAPMPVNVISDDSLATTRLLQYLDSPRGYDKAQQRQRGTVVVESGTVTTVSTVTTVTTVTTVSTVSSVSSVANIAAIDGYNARLQILDGNRTAWAQTVRSRIT